MTYEWYENFIAQLPHDKRARLESLVSRLMNLDLSDVWRFSWHGDTLILQARDSFKIVSADMAIVELAVNALQLKD
jgi:hypothetical protein